MAGYLIGTQAQAYQLAQAIIADAELLPSCIIEKQHHDIKSLSCEQFHAIIFADAGQEPRAVRDAFTLDELFIIAQSESFQFWPTPDKEWLWSALRADS